MFSLCNFSSIFPGVSADPICPYVRTPMREQAVDGEVDARLDVDEQVGGGLQVEDHVTTGVSHLYASHAVKTSSGDQQTTTIVMNDVAIKRVFRQSNHNVNYFWQPEPGLSPHARANA